MSATASVSSSSTAAMESPPDVLDRGTAIGRFVVRNKQYTAAIRAVDGRVLLSTMVYGDEIVQPSAIDEF